MRVGYARVSRKDQSLEPQRDTLLADGCETVFEEKVSSREVDRKALQGAFDYCREGDVLVMVRLDRLGRSLRELIDLVGELEGQGVGFRSLKESLDTTTAGGRLIFHVFGALAEFEWEIIRERTLARLESARARGRYGGRPRCSTRTGRGWRGAQKTRASTRWKRFAPCSGWGGPHSTGTWATMTATSEAAEAYEEELRTFFQTEDVPLFDLILLGIGADGHTASLFPVTSAIEVHDRWVVANPVLKLDTTRITLTIPIINAARAVIFLVAGGDKAEALGEILEGDADPRAYPARLIQPPGGPQWLLDQDAASLLDEHST